MNKLPSDFRFSRYGLDVRLVDEKDAEFILKLRTNEKLSRHIHSTDDDLIKQVNWIRDYKKREEEGKEYYFIYLKDDKPIGVTRISNIYEYFGLGGSWLCSPDNDPIDSVKTLFVGNDIVFDLIGLDYTVIDVRKANVQVWKFHLKTGAVILGESEIDYYLYLYKKNYYKNRVKFLKWLNV